MRLYSELDLVAAECLRRGLWDELTVPELAAVLSVLVFEARRPDDASAPRLPGGPVKLVIAEMVRLWAELDQLEREHHLDYLRQPDLGFAWAAYRWAEGDELDDVLSDVDLAAGDFVRWMKQLVDVAGQVADAAGAAPLRDTARQVVRALRRGVVAHSDWPRTDAAPTWSARSSAAVQTRQRAAVTLGTQPTVQHVTRLQHHRVHRPRTVGPEIQHLVEHPVRRHPGRGVQLLDQDRTIAATHVGPGHHVARGLTGAPQDQCLAQHQRGVGGQGHRQACGVRRRPQPRRTAARATPGRHPPRSRR